jgi:hypothetical protein
MLKTLTARVHPCSVCFHVEAGSSPADAWVHCLLRVGQWGLLAIGPCSHSEFFL